MIPSGIPETSYCSVDSLAGWPIRSDPLLDSWIQGIMRHLASPHKSFESFIGIVALAFFAEAGSVVQVEIQDDLGHIRKRKEEPVPSEALLIPAVLL